VRRALVIAALALAAGCRHAPSEADCGRLFDHFLDVEAVAATDGKFVEITPAMAAALDKEKAEFRRQRGEDFVGECVDDLKPAQVECAMTAQSEQGMDDCTQ
jgi:hypothetical protein